jgi:cytochrome c
VRTPVFAFAALLAAGPASAQDGARAFERHCASCHALAPTAQALPGPSLASLAGRTIAGDPAFDYSPAMRAGRADGKRWDRETLARFLADPEAMFPGLWMGGAGVRDAGERAALAEFLTR